MTLAHPNRFRFLGFGAALKKTHTREAGIRLAKRVLSAWTCLGEALVSGPSSAPQSRPFQKSLMCSLSSSRSLMGVFSPRGARELEQALGINHYDSESLTQ